MQHGEGEWWLGGPIVPKKIKWDCPCAIVQGPDTPETVQENNG